MKLPFDDPFAPLDAKIRSEKPHLSTIDMELDRLRRYVKALEDLVKPGLIAAIRKAVWG